MHSSEAMSNSCLHTACALALTAAIAGCASMGDVPTQQIEVHTILDHREVAGVGCVLANSAGRWFVVAPGRITVQRSRDPLTVDCARDGVGAVEVAQARSASVFDGDKLIGNLIITAGMGDYVSRFDGAGVAYQSTLTVLMHPAQGRTDGRQDTEASADSLF
jgi:hypothetical protein